MSRADLHVHTTASDGQLSPPDVIQLGVQRQLDAVAITDHDTMAGVLPAQEAARGNLDVIPGIEIGARSGADAVDVLGYFVDSHHAGLQARLQYFQQNRLQRGQKIVERLAALGLPVEWARVTAFANGDTVGRPHIARAMVEAGYVQSTREAFERYLGDTRPAYVARETLTPEEAIQLVHAAGGAAVLAHPVFVPDFAAMVARLAPAGLDGIEVSYPEHSPEIEAQARALAHEYGLVMTGGSDFHGLNVPGKATLGSSLAPPGAVEALRERAGRYVVR